MFIVLCLALIVNSGLAQEPPKPDAVAAISPDGAKDVAPDEIAGRVVDANGKPIPGVEVDHYYWVPKHAATTTDSDGVFRFKKLDPKDDGQHIRIRPAKHAWQEFMSRKPGEAGWLVTLRDDTKIEGRVTDREGKPVGDAKIVADQGPRRARGYMQGQTLTEVKSGKDGRYVLYVEPGGYDVAVRVAGVGVARKGLVVADAEVKSLDLKLERGVNFTALFIDHDSGEPVSGAKLSHWQKPGIEGISDERGVIVIRDVPPGAYDRFQVEAPGYARWWCDAAKSEWSRKQTRGDFQRNFDGLDFDVTPDFGPVTVEMERGATVRGRVLDPDGKPVEGATVDAARTGSGSSLTGDTRFSVRTDKGGRFVSNLPASNDFEYNLVAHDGDYQESRTWANGTSKPFRTLPGSEKQDVELRLARPGIVTGRVVDSEGKPVKGRQVQCIPTALDQVRYYAPTAVTDADGKFTIKCAGAGEAVVHVAPFWFDPKEAPPGTTAKVEIKPGETQEGIELTAQPQQ